MLERLSYFTIPENLIKLDKNEFLMYIHCRYKKGGDNMKTNIKKWGNSLSVRIPKIIADEIGLKENSTVDIIIKKRKLVISPVEKPKKTLNQLLSKVKKNNLHTEIDIGKPVGGEIW